VLCVCVCVENNNGEARRLCRSVISFTPGSNKMTQTRLSRKRKGERGKTEKNACRSDYEGHTHTHTYTHMRIIQFVVQF
jgi:hypothetical protein